MSSKRLSSRTGKKIGLSAANSSATRWLSETPSFTPRSRRLTAIQSAGPVRT